MKLVANFWMAANPTALDAFNNAVVKGNAQSRKYFDGPDAKTVIGFVFLCHKHGDTSTLSKLDRKIEQLRQTYKSEGWLRSIRFVSFALGAAHVNVADEFAWKICGVSAAGRDFSPASDLPSVCIGEKVLRPDGSEASGV
eukprot:TRINITY_DN114124_c0_g1_i1.p1 TRINITY_DN114124_c0_g1~~TRINITY_DN114124_c0_g1_i1.p1  ORF type:complete len:140 (-),score=33.07 TRINITY_DN114124_c0_g1_i1:37-456(-)